MSACVSSPVVSIVVYFVVSADGVASFVPHAEIIPATSTAAVTIAILLFI